MSRRYEIEFSKTVKQDLKQLRAYDLPGLFDAIESQLRYTPLVETRNRKLLHNLVPPFEAIAPVWQLRVGELRVFYDVEERGRRVIIRAVRRKTPHTKTEEIL